MWHEFLGLTEGEFKRKRTPPTDGADAAAEPLIQVVIIKRMSKEEARDVARGVFKIVQSIVQWFITQITDKKAAKPMPIDWIWTHRCMACIYGLIWWLGAVLIGKVTTFCTGGFDSIWDSY